MPDPTPTNPPPPYEYPVGYTPPPLDAPPQAPANQQPVAPQVVIQPVPVPVQQMQQPVLETAQPDEQGHPEVIIYSHTSLFYWWPVWAAGYILAFVTYMNGVPYEAVGGEPAAAQAPANGAASDIHRRLDGDTVVFHRSSNLGALFLVTLFLTTMITNVTVRGLASIIVILLILLTTVLLAYFDLWDNVLGWLGGLKIYLNLGAYFWFATLMFVAWALATFVFDRLSYWRIKPGQVTQEFVLGAASRSYDTENMVLEKYRDDFFRHWVLGFGSGDLRIKPYGSEREEIAIRNVLFAGAKVADIQKLIATEPASFGHPILRG